MEVESVLCMNPGDGETSYANNSFLSKTVILKARPFLEGAIKDMFDTSLPTCFKLADLGCSSGPDTLLVTSEIMDVIYELCQQLNCKLPEFQVFLNDLPGNDFNTVFKSLPSFYEKLRKENGSLSWSCFISGVPGSFYGRLFPSKSLHFFHSSYSLHWLSQVPQGILNNKGNIYIAKSSPPNVLKAYLEQFQKDFSMFLSFRSEEIIPGGRMVLTFIGRSTIDPTSRDCCAAWGLLAKSLVEMVSERLIEEADVDNFNLPYYNPYEGEIRTVIEKEGSFNIDKLETFAVNWHGNEDVDDNNFASKKHQVAKITRAVAEPMLASHFGGHIGDELFKRYAEHVGEHLSVHKTKHTTIVLTMSKK